MSDQSEPGELPPREVTDQSIRSYADLTMLEHWRAHRTGLAPYYPLLYSLVIGMGAQRVFEFGTGESSRVLASALRQTGGWLHSVAPIEGVRDGLRIGEEVNWTHHAMLSEAIYPDLPDLAKDGFDLVLHDGSHSADVVAADLIGILPRMRPGGLVLIHDTLHSYVGKQMREGVFNGRSGPPVMRSLTSSITLPFAFGLTVLQVEWSGAGNIEPVSLGPDKPTSPHRTLRWGEEI